MASFLSFYERLILLDEQPLDFPDRLILTDFELLFIDHIAARNVKSLFQRAIFDLCVRFNR